VRRHSNCITKLAKERAILKLESISSRRGSTFLSQAVLASIVFFSAAAFSASRLKISNAEVSPSLAGNFEDLVGKTFERQISHGTSSDFLRRMGQSVVLSHSSAGVDYASDFRFLSFSLGTGLGYQEGYASLDDVISGRESPDGLSGLAAQVGMTLGLHFHEAQRSRFFLSYLQSNFSEDGLKVTGNGFGVLWQYRVLSEKVLAGPFAEFRGLHFGAGLRYAEFNSEYETRLLGLQVNGSSIASELSDYKLNAAANLDLQSEVSVWSVPLEISAAVNFFRSISFYSLLGMDINFGNSSAQAVLNSPVEIQDTKTAAKLASADVSLVSLQEETVDRTHYRGLLGMQFELGRGSVFIQYQRAFDIGTHAASLGFRAYY